MVAGAATVIIWIVFIKPLADINEIFGLYEIIPGFIMSVIFTYVVSKLTQNQVHARSENWTKLNKFFILNNLH